MIRINRLSADPNPATDHPTVEGDHPDVKPSVFRDEVQCRARVLVFGVSVRCTLQSEHFGKFYDSDHEVKLARGAILRWR